jgi:hypothetical protein
MAGGSFAAGALASAGTVTGFGTVSPAVANTGVVRADGGTVELRCTEGSPHARLPMDPNIRIDRAELGAGLLHLEGEARVSP